MAVFTLKQPAYFMPVDTSQIRRYNTNMNGKPRNVTKKILKLLEVFPVVAIIGARQTGKTSLAKFIGKNWYYLDLEKPSDYQRIDDDANLFFQQHPGQVIIDEAQAVPKLFKVLRGVIDEDRKHHGRFILTGSSSPALLTQISESLSGRIAIIELGTFKANEVYETPLSPFYNIFTENFDLTELKNHAPLSNQQMQQIWLKGGYPEPVLANDDFIYQHWMEQYQDTYINRDVAKLFPRLNKINYQRFIYMLGKLSGTILNRSNIARNLEVSEGSIREYLRIADGTFLWRELPSYEKNIMKATIKMPKGYIRDSGLLHHFLKIMSLDDLYLNPILGSSFEGFVIEEILKGLSATFVTNWDCYHYRTRNGAEIDLILEGPFGILPIEIKHGSVCTLKQLRTLQQFIDEHQLLLGLVINQSNEVTWLTSKILQVPVGWL